MVLSELKQAAQKGQAAAVVLLDADLPGINLVDLARSISSEPVTRDAAVVALVSSLRDDLPELRRAGIYTHIHKPVLPSQLHELLMDVLRLPHQPAGEKAVQPRTGRPRVLIADDNEVNQRIAARYLAAIGIEADLVTTGRQAVAAAERHAYDLILMDCLMPEMDGFEATIQIRRLEGAARHTNICALTALTMDGSRERCLAAGMDDFISKPFSAAELQNTVHRLIGYAVAR
jgi:CheY-like chemotaxis protein